ncbi:ATP-binding cassette, subfamily C, CydC [Marinobacter gudaonensis]|uniref:ATP-binding cassette, subfamily C, CydC n=1 Tax=Marinobacter gudaonensis TaxID=375760 RepID=A0A1I6GBC0_9GAMM|nr:thiol reductant ABC exporter subunit CydC [Marinobacter gudaonensis]SFR39430.1 ATP-binding cassette, subfamily C, CydC [Marinobacter gudaonensis]
MRELKPWLQLIFKRPVRLFAGGALMFATLLSGLSLLAASGWFITETAIVGLLLAAGTAATINLYVPGGAIRFFAVSRTVFRYLERVYNHDTVLRLLTDIRVALFKGLAGTHGPGRSGLSGAQWLSRLTSDVDALDTLYLRLIAPTALAGLTTMLVLILATVLFDPNTALWLTLVLLAALLVATASVYLATSDLAARQSTRQDDLRTAVIEHIEGFPELTAAGRTGKHAAWLMRQAHQANAEQARVDTRVGWHLAGSHLLIHLAAVLALWLGLALFQAGAITGPVLVLLPIALLGLAEVFAMLPDAFGKLGATMASAARLNRDCRKGQRPQVGAVGELNAGTALQADNITVKYAGYAPLFSHFNLTVSSGERLGVIGHSGSGKSSLADALAGLLPLPHGSLAREACAYLTQKTVLFDDTLRANLLLGAPDASDTELWRILEHMELADRFATEPDRLDTWIGSSGSRLSGGEARRLALARVLLSPAPLVILDEPFTGLDVDTRARIAKRLETLLEGKTLIVLAHGPDALPGTDRVLSLSG